MSEFKEGDRMYCWYIGCVVPANKEGLCPECGPYTKGHQPHTEPTCGNFATCPGAEHGHPCTQPRDHDGKCSTEGCAPTPEAP